jgi:hypothetical protein
MNRDPAAIDHYKQYIEGTLTLHEALIPVLPTSTIIVNDYGHVWDCLIILTDELFEEHIDRKYGSSFVIDDHEHIPWVFTKARSFGWLRQDVTRRLAIALWIYSRAEVIQDPAQRFSSLVQSYQREYTKQIPDILRQKYLELRSERHNLRFAILHGRDVAAELIKSCLVKLALELCYVSEEKAYPFKAHLPHNAAKDTKNGEVVLAHSKKLLWSHDPHEAIHITDDLIRDIDRFLIASPYITEDFLRSWWLYLP